MESLLKLPHAVRRVYCEVYFYFTFFIKKNLFLVLNSKILFFVLVNILFIVNYIYYCFHKFIVIYSNEVKCKKGIQGPNFVFSNKA